MECAAQTGGASADNQHIRFELFALDGHIHFAFCNSSVRAGMISKMSPTTP
jgi:hypothetical protein